MHFLLKFFPVVFSCHSEFPLLLGLVVFSCFFLSAVSVLVSALIMRCPANSVADCFHGITTCMTSLPQAPMGGRRHLFYRECWFSALRFPSHLVCFLQFFSLLCSGLLSSSLSTLPQLFLQWVFLFIYLGYIYHVATARSSRIT